MKNLYLIFTSILLTISCNQESSKVMLKLFSMKTSNKFILNIPETSSHSELSEFQKINSNEYVKGTYTDGYERGNVFLDYLKINSINLTESKTLFYFVAPFIVSNQGSGSFNYLGLFVQDSKKMTIKHLDSFFLGDRIIIEKINPIMDEVSILIKEHSQKQVMAESPNKSKTIQLKTRTTGFVK